MKHEVHTIPEGVTTHIIRATPATKRPVEIGHATVSIGDDVGQRSIGYVGVFAIAEVLIDRCGRVARRLSRRRRHVEEVAANFT